MIWLTDDNTKKGSEGGGKCIKGYVGGVGTGDLVWEWRRMIGITPKQEFGHGVERGQSC